jgi:Methyltransferase domain
MTMEGELSWSEADGVGHCALHTPGLYDAAYFDEYARRGDTTMGKALNRARVSMAERHALGEPLLDVGSGAGHFILAREASVAPGLTRGYDVNPKAIEWLKARGLWYDAAAGPLGNVSFFDSLEHIPDPGQILRRVRGIVFVSIPVFRGREHVLSSRHWKPGEHLWYFTRDGLVRFMGREGFAMTEENRMETEIGRDGIASFAFRRASS